MVRDAHVHAAELRDEGEASHRSAWRRCAGRRARSATRLHIDGRDRRGSGARNRAGAAAHATVLATVKTDRARPTGGSR
jgi:hypothetical protein